MSTALADLHAYRPAPDALAGRVILVTGATGGIGRAVSRALVAHGASVVLHGRKGKALQALFEELAPLGPEPTLVELDFERAQGPAYQALIDALEERYGRLDGLLHNAALLGQLAPIEHYDIAQWQRVMHVNVNAPFILTRCLLPLLKQSADATLLFTTSNVGHKGRAFWGAYCASKFATEGLAQVLAEELDETPVRVNVVNPGRVRTKMRTQAYPAEDPQSVAAPDTLASAYVYLLGPDSRGVRGQRIDLQPG